MAEEGAEKQEECEAEVKSKRQFEVNKKVKIKVMKSENKLLNLLGKLKLKTKENILFLKS